MGFTDTLARVAEIRQAETPGTYIKQRVAEHASQLSNAAHIQASIECANESLCRLVSVLYECIDRQPVNLDSKTYRLLIPVPWGDSGYQHWGLRSTEARILRRALMERASKDRLALFDYADRHRQWFLNMDTYPTAQLALEYLHSKPVSAREWMRYLSAWKEHSQQRMTANRTRTERKGYAKAK